MLRIGPISKQSILYTLPMGVGEDSKELLRKERQAAKEFYAASELIRDYSLLVQEPNTTGPAEIIANNAVLNRVINEIHSLLLWETDSYGSLAPRYSSIVHAENWIKRFYAQVAFGNWLNPNVTAGPEGEVVFEWWHGTKKLTVYVSSQDVEYVKVWGTDIYTDMADGDAEPIDTCKELWSWLRI